MARLIDTSVVIGLERRGLSLADSPAFLQGAPVALASVTVSEILAGLHRSTAGRRKVLRQAFIEEMLVQFPVLPFDLDAARGHAPLVDTLRRAGRPVGLNDTLIAAIALSNQYSVLTHNLRDFERIPGLGVEQPTWSD